MSETGALCPVFDKPEQGLDLLVEAITAANLTPGEDIHIAINAAGHEMMDFVSAMLCVCVCVCVCVFVSVHPFVPGCICVCLSRYV